MAERGTARGRLGLALSGGGLRAACFHLGLLARMADADLLRHVEVISAVSGGSIVAALYCLKMKRLLETKADAAIGRDDYQALVHDLIGSFLAAVRRNIRLLAFADPVKNWRMRRPDYSRTDRLAELLDALLFRPAIGSGRRSPVLMEELVIRPKGAPDAFRPDRDNPSRRAKVPILIIQATSLNTGRAWRFEAIRMGESSAPRGDPRGGRIPLGSAVAASAAVPGLFHPLAVAGPGREERVALVDGGLYDNQGIQGLIERGCSAWVVSDGSAPVEAIDSPSMSLPAVLLRSSEILMGRLREEQLLRGAAGTGAGGLCLIHLGQGWEAEASGGGAGIDPRVQRALARIRTDLDAFNDAEACSLMLLGYRAAGQELPKAAAIWARASGGAGAGKAWPFEAWGPLLARPTRRYLRTLNIGASNVLKVPLLYPWLSAAGALLPLAAAVRWLLARPEQLVLALPPISAAGAAFLLGLLLLAAAGWLPRARAFAASVAWIRWAARRGGSPRAAALRLAARFLPALAAAVVSRLALSLVNPLYLRAGRLARCMDSRLGPQAPDLGFPGRGYATNSVNQSGGAQDLVYYGRNSPGAG